MKILESIHKNRIDAIFDSQQNPMQRGFSANSSSMNAALIISETIYITNSSDNLYLASLDAQKAFDTVDHNIMFNKLYYIGIQGHLWILLRNLYKNTSVKVK
ncbi:hypothetical protein DPMN_042094 [Dreissena polymorpha]|uniref:Reverse transcriptase domain-containing protein n=1 Tax=Dreissena polymorpha TaxID=45954 RepID=A0A9D4D1D5_DREPO|nr:hypothetical protein DPMN_042094 [Dreissena polymorpha]